jgi:hypothetical protein
MSLNAIALDLVPDLLLPFFYHVISYPVRAFRSRALHGFFIAVFGFCLPID